MFKLSTAPVLTQIISFILLPLISRLYSPEIFGVFNIFGASVGVLGVFVGLGYHQAIVLPHKGKDAYILLKVSIVLTGILGILLLGIISFLPPSIFLKLNIEQLYEYKYYIVLGVLIHGLYMSFLGWNLRNKHFGSIATSRVLDVVANKGFIILVGFFGFASAASLIIGQIFGQIVMAGLLFIITWKTGKEYIKRNFSIPYIKKQLIRYIQFPKYKMGTDLFFRLSEALILLLIAYWFSEDTIGHYGMAIAILAIPTTLIGSPVGEVYYQQLPVMINDGKGAEFSVKLLSVLISLSLIIFTILTIYGNVLLPFALGERWLEAGILVQLLSFRIFIQFLVGPFQNILKILDKQQYLIILHAVLLVLSIGSIVTGGILGSSYLAFGIFSIVDGIATLFFGLYIFKLLGIKAKKFGFIFIKYFLYALPYIIILLLMRYWFKNSIIMAITVSILSLIGYYVTLFYYDKGFQSLLNPVLKKINILKK